MRDAMMLAVGLACGIAWQYMLDARKRDELRKLRRHAAEHAAEAAELRAKRSAASLRGWQRRRNASVRVGGTPYHARSVGREGEQ